MAVREFLQKYSAVAMAAVAVLIVLCVTLIYSGVKGPDYSNAGKVFYSDDDGKTWFLDDPAKGSPFDHGGKQACRALLYRCPGGPPFVAYLAKFSHRQIAQMGSGNRFLGAIMEDVKKPGDSNWVKNSAMAQTDYPPVACPGGAGNPMAVSPLDPNSGAK